MALALGALLVLGAVTAANLAGPARNSIHADGPRGLDGLASSLQSQGYRVATIGSSTHALDAFEEPGRTVLVVAGVERAYTAGEVAALTTFVDRGGVAIVADDFGFGDRVGEHFGVNVDNRVMRENAPNFHRNVSFPVVNATFGGAKVQFTMNVPTTLGFAPDARVEVLAASSRDSYLDLNQNGVEEPEDVKGPFPVLAAVRPDGAAGKVLFLSDPGVFANDLADRNAPFLRALFRDLLPDGGTVAFDESRHAVGLPAAVVAAVVAGEVQATSEPVLAGVVTVAAAALALALWRGFRAPEALATHRGRLAEPLGEAGTATAEARLRELATLSARDRFPGGSASSEGASAAELARHIGDPALAALLTGAPSKASHADLLQRIQRIEREARRQTPAQRPGGDGR